MAGGKGVDETTATTEPVRRPASPPSETSEQRKFVGVGELERTGYIDPETAAAPVECDLCKQGRPVDSNGYHDSPHAAHHWIKCSAANRMT